MLMAVITFVLDVAYIALLGSRRRAESSGVLARSDQERGHGQVRPVQFVARFVFVHSWPRAGLALPSRAGF